MTSRRRRRHRPKQRGKFIGDGRQQIRGRGLSFPGVPCPETVPDAATARHDETQAMLY